MRRGAPRCAEVHRGASACASVCVEVPRRRGDACGRACGHVRVCVCARVRARVPRGCGAPSIGLGMCERSQMSAWLSSPAVLMWHDECGAHASELTHCEWPCSFAAGSEGTRMSRITTQFESIVITAK